MVFPGRIRPRLAGGLLVFLLAVRALPAFAAGWAVGGNGLVIRSDDAGQTWSSSTPATATLNAVHFVSDTEGWAVGNGGIAIHTTDGGASWTQTSPAAVTLRGVFFVDAAHGWIVGEGGRVLRTTDGGASWTTSAPTSAVLYSVYFIDANTGWAAGKGVVLRTVNGGATWSAGAPSAETLRGVSFANATTGWVVGTNGVILKTTNGGSSWTTTRPTTSNLNSVHFVDATHGWAAGDQGIVLRTVDGGSSWTEQRPANANLESIHFIDDRVGWAVGGAGAVATTIDGGDTWTASSPATVQLNGVFFASASNRISVTVATSPSGRTITVDGTGYAAPHSFLWNAGDAHTIATTSPQSGTSGTRYVWENWSDGGAISHTVTPSANTTVTATFTTQYQLTMTAGANGSVSPASGWVDAGTGLSIEATPDPGFGFNGWTGSGGGSYTGWANPEPITVGGPITETAAFGTDVTVVVECNPQAASFAVDGTSYTTTQQFTWTPGSTHTIDAASPQPVSADTRYVFSRWSDGGTESHTVAPVSNTTYAATFKTQFMLTVSAGAGGTVTTPGGWTDAGTILMLTAVPDSGYSFQAWTGSGPGSYNGPANPKSISMNGPITQQASFTVGTTPAMPPALTLLGNSPNPFRTGTDIRFGLPAAADVHIDVFDITGRRVFSDEVPDEPGGWQTYRFESAKAAHRLASGVYFVRVSTPRAARTGRIVILR